MIVLILVVIVFAVLLAFFCFVSSVFLEVFVIRSGILIGGRGVWLLMTFVFA
jgi:hypothetical protein